MSLHKAVVGLAAENRLLAAPASAQAFDTSTGQEDLQAFEFLAADKLSRALDNLELAFACELVALRQGFHLRGEPPPQPPGAAPREAGNRSSRSSWIERSRATSNVCASSFAPDR